MDGELTTALVPSGYYSDPGQIISTMNSVMTKLSGGGPKVVREIDFSYDKANGSVTLLMRGRGVIEFPAGSYIGERLGFNSSAKGLLIAGKTYQVNTSLNGWSDAEDIYVYTNVVELQHIGGTQAPLLRVIAIDGEHGATVQKSFVSQHYMPVPKNDFDEVEIKLCDRDGLDILFERDTVVIVVLHFKPVSGLYR